MFSEFLRIKPVLDPGTSASMERSLSQRFGRVAKRFGQGLKGVVKGSILGISLGLLNKLLNPLSDLEEKIKSLLGQGSDIRDIADKFGSDPGKIKRLQDVAGTVGLAPEQLREMLTKFSEAIEKRSPTVRNFRQKDEAEGFFAFIQSLKAAAPSFRKTAERDIFGDELFGAAKRFVETDFSKALLGIPGVGASGKAVKNLAAKSDLQNRISTINQSNDFISASGRISAKMIRDIEKAEQLKRERETKQLQSFDDLKKASIAIEQVKNLFEDLVIGINKGIGYLADLVTFTTKLKDTRWFRGIFGGGK